MKDNDIKLTGQFRANSVRHFDKFLLRSIFTSREVEEALVLVRLRVGPAHGLEVLGALVLAAG